MKTTNKLLIISMMLTVGMIETNGQNTFPIGVGTSVGIGTNAPATRLQVIGGASRFGAAANYGQFATDGDLTFTGAADYLVGGNRYAFRYSANQNYGIFFNSTNLRYEFRDGAALPVFYATTSGEGFFSKGVQIGNSALLNAGNIRWTGADFEGYTGAVWKSLTATGLLAETDPQVGANTTSKVPRWDGSALVGGTIYDNATNVGVGTTTPACKLAVSNTTLGGIATTGSFQIGESNTSNLVMDNNEVQARFNGGTSTLFLQYWDGDLNACNNGGTSTFGGSVNSIGTLSAFSGASVIGLVDLTSQNATSSYTDNNLTIDGSGGSFYPAISLTYAGDGNQIFGTTSGGNGVLIYNAAGTGYSPISASAFNVGSDRSLKKDITEIKEDNYTTYLDQIRGIESITYRYNNELAAPGGDPTAPVREFPHVGFVAQTLPDAIQTKIPVSGKVGAEMKLGYNLSDMAGLTLIGIKAIDAKAQDLEKQVADLQTTVKDLENALASCCSNFSSERNVVDNLSVAEQAKLEQNAPNPFSEKTTINYYIPSNVKNALVKIYSLNGDEIKTIKVNGTGKGSVEVNGGSFAAGTYTYQLILDEKTIDTKLMVITK
jgi:Chaperone of endosialidase